MHLFDLHTHVETVFKEILDEVFDCHLVNLNIENPNAPGLDLGAKNERIAFQITADKRSKKVNKTLKKITKEQLSDYDDIFILTVVERQSRYSIDKKMAKKVHEFTEDRIIDYRDIVKRLMDADFETVRTVHDKLQSETQRVIISLEVPDENGKFPTSLRELMESIPVPQMGTGKPYATFSETEFGAGGNSDDVVEELTLFSNALTRLPRITREFLVLAFEIGDHYSGLGTGDQYKINAEKMKRLFRAFDWHGEYLLLKDEGFAEFIDWEDGEPPYYCFHGNGLDYIPLPSLLDFIDRKGISQSKVLVALDFSDF